MLIVSLLGSASACALFGTSSNLSEAIAIRLLQGVFAGAIGVARSSITVVTDLSNGLLFEMIDKYTNFLQRARRMPY